MVSLFLFLKIFYLMINYFHFIKTDAITNLFKSYLEDFNKH